MVVFRDSIIAENDPGMYLLGHSEVWNNGSGDAFVNAFNEDVWDYNLAVAKEAAEMGFQEIQFDYVRFPEGFENRADTLNYDKGEYAAIEDDVEGRVTAINEFVA